MIGYHYTTYRNWLRIKRKGLYPHFVSEVSEIYNKRIEGVWVWRKKQVGKAHIGNIMRVAAKHNTSRIVVLRVFYKDKDILRMWGGRVSISHDGNIDRFIYHKKDRDYSWLLNKVIDPIDIELVGDYDLRVLFR